MHSRSETRISLAVPAEWLEALREAARRAGLAQPVEVVRAWMLGAELVVTVRQLGGSVRPVEPFHHWIVEPREGPWQRTVAAHAPDLVRDGVTLRDFVGVVEIALEGRRWLALRADAQSCPYPVDRALLLAGGDLGELLALVARLERARDDVAGSEIVSCGTGLAPAAQADVSEADLILDADLIRDLLGYLDRYWKSADVCRQLRIAPSRGVLLVGAPGTGKTLTVRHLLTRYAFCRRFVYVAENGRVAGSGDHSFRAMVDAVRASRRPALVVLEDIDRILDDGSVTPGFLLNVLDGLLQPESPVLWVLTSNDPSELSDSILDRPGRIDRIFEFPLPRRAERARLLERYSPWPVPGDILAKLAARTSGLSGAHLKEACYSAALVAAEEPVMYPNVLEVEVWRVKKGHRNVEGSQHLLGRTSSPAGFRTE